MIAVAGANLAAGGLAWWNARAAKTKAAEVMAGVHKVNGAVHTQNGQSIGTLAENAEARWIQSNVPASEMTADEKGYIERKKVNGEQT